MEDTLRGKFIFGTIFGAVLILVLMEDTLRAEFNISLELYRSLNPCFNGRYSQSHSMNKDDTHCSCLNPCFNGRYSQSLSFAYYAKKPLRS